MGVKVTEGEATSVTGEKLYTTSYLPDEPPRAAFVIHHGLAEHIGRYTPSKMVECLWGVSDVRDC